MTNPEQRVLDAIDALVDEQLQQTRSGYDYNVNQQTCRICGGDTHTLPITERMREMRALHQRTVGLYEGEARVSQQVVDELNTYRYDEDDSRIVCPGSDFIGPMPAPVGMWSIPDDPLDYFVDDETREREGRAVEELRRTHTFDVATNAWMRIQSMLDALRAVGGLASAFQDMAEALVEFGAAFADEPNVTEEGLSPQQRAVPRPSTSPPMWAVDPTRQRRRRRV